MAEEHCEMRACAAKCSIIPDRGCVSVEGKDPNTVTVKIEIILNEIAQTVGGTAPFQIDKLIFKKDGKVITDIEHEVISGFGNSLGEDQTKINVTATITAPPTYLDADLGKLQVFLTTPTNPGREITCNELKYCVHKYTLTASPRAIMCVGDTIDIIVTEQGCPDSPPINVTAQRPDEAIFTEPAPGGAEVQVSPNPTATLKLKGLKGADDTAITVSEDAFTCAEINIDVLKIEKPTFNPTALCADGKSTAQATAKTTPEGRTLKWEIVGDPLGCSINEDTGIITAGEAAGNITIRASDAEVTDCESEGAMLDVVKVSDIQFSPAAACVKPKHGSTATATIIPNNRKIKWTASANSSDATIDVNTGVITPNTTPGIMKVRASDSELTDCYIENDIDIVQVFITEFQGIIEVGMSGNLVASIVPDHRNIKWSIVSGNATLSANSGKTTTITSSTPGVVKVKAQDSVMNDCAETVEIIFIKIDYQIFLPKVINTSEPIVPDNLKDSQGSVTFVNLDNDDNDSKYDKNDDVVARGDDELVRMRVKITPNINIPGHVAISTISGSLATTGTDTFILWSTNDKSAGSQLDTDFNIFNVFADFIDESGSLVKDMWIEGVVAHNVQREIRFEMTYSQLPTPQRVTCTVVGIQSLKWIGKGNGETADGKHNSNDLKADPKYPTGAFDPASNRVFPDARSPNYGKPLDTVELEVELTVEPVRSVDIFIRSFDIDDPSADPAIDPNDAGVAGTYAGTPITYSPEEDNRGSVGGKRSGKITGEDADGIAKLTFTPSDKTKKVDFEVTLQPGDNFRVAANGDKQYLKRLRNLDKDDGFRIVDPSVAGSADDREVRNTANYESNVLSIWRILHIERDSMIAVPTTGVQSNTVMGTIEGVTGTAAAATRATLSVNLKTGIPSGADNSKNLSDASPQNGRFENGTITIGLALPIAALLGNGNDYVQKTAGGGIIIPFKISKVPFVSLSGTVIGFNKPTKLFTLRITTGFLTHQYSGGILDVAGVKMRIGQVNAAASTVAVPNLSSIPFTLVDDDIFVLPELPNISLVISAYREAYLDVIDDAGGDIKNNTNTVSFILNIDFTNSALKAAMNQPNGIKSDANRTDAFWIAYVLNAYQTQTTADIDSNYEISDPAASTGQTPSVPPKLGSVIFPEMQRDIIIIHSISGDAVQHRAKTVAHEIGHQFNLDHDTDIMGPFGNGAKTFNSSHIGNIRVRILSPGK